MQTWMQSSGKAGPVFAPGVPVGERVVELRRWLQEREVAACQLARPGLTTGVAAVDGVLPEGVPWGAITEVAAPRPSCGGQTVLVGLLRAARAARVRAALVDGWDCFDPESAGLEVLEHVLWARGTGRVVDAVRAADLVVRDGNLPLVVLDLRSADVREVKRQQPAVWYRLQRAVEETTVALVVFTPAPLLASAALRIGLLAPFPLAACEAGVRVEAQVHRRRGVWPAEAGARRAG